MVYLSTVPHSYAVFDSATAVSWRKLQKTTSPGTLHGRCTHNKAVGTSKYHNIGHSYRSWVPSRQTTNRPIHLSIRQDILRQSTPLMPSRLSNQPSLGIQTVESAITWHPDCRISHYLAFRVSP